MVILVTNVPKHGQTQALEAQADGADAELPRTDGVASECHGTSYARGTITLA